MPSCRSCATSCSPPRPRRSRTRRISSAAWFLSNLAADTIRAGATPQSATLAIAARVADAGVVGNPRDKGIRIGPVVSELQWNKIQDLIKKGIDEGATLATGGTGRPDGLEKGYYVKPTVFADVSNDMTIAREEIFGPVISIIGYDTEDEAVEIANDTVYGLAAYVTSTEMERAKAVARRLRAGQVAINYKGGGPDTPFGGYKQSGNGREKGKWGLAEFLELKAITGSNTGARKANGDSPSSSSSRR